MLLPCTWGFLASFWLQCMPNIKDDPKGNAISLVATVYLSQNRSLHLWHFHYVHIGTFWQKSNNVGSPSGKLLSMCQCARHPCWDPRQCLWGAPPFSFRMPFSTRNWLIPYCLKLPFHVLQSSFISNRCNECSMATSQDQIHHQVMQSSCRIHLQQF